MNCQIPLKKTLDDWRQKNPEYSQARIAVELEISPPSLSLLLNRGQFPKKPSIKEFQKNVVEKLRLLGVPVADPPEANFTGAEEGDREIGRYPKARWLCLEVGLSCREIGLEAGLPRSVVNDWLLGRLPWKPSAGKVDFLEALPRILGRYFPEGDLADMWEPLTRIEYEAERQKTREGEKVMLTREALRYYKFSRNPFAVDEPLMVNELYFSEAYREILDRLLQAAQGRKFFILLGPTGSGKSEMLKAAAELLQRIPLAVKNEIFELAEIEAMPYISEEEQAYKIVEPAKQMAQKVDAGNFLNLLLAEMGVGNLKQDIYGKAANLKAALVKSEQKVVLWIDEGNQMQADTLRSLKAFFELTKKKTYERLLSVIVAGQPVGLKDKIEFLPILKEIDSRSVQNQLEPLKNGDGEAYIESRLALVKKEAKDIFTEEALKELLDRADRFGGRTPTRINRIAMAALMWKFTHNPNAKLVGIDEVLR